MGDKVICLQNSSTILAELVLEVQSEPCLQKRSRLHNSNNFIFVTLSFLLTSGIKKIPPFRSFIFSLGKATSFRALPSAPLASTYFLPSFSQNFNLKAGSKLKLSQKLSYIEPLIFDFEEIIKI